MSQQPSPPGWDLGIDYPQEDEDEPFKLNNGGGVIVSFFVSNDELLPITVDFTSFSYTHLTLPTKCSV